MARIVIVEDEQSLLKILTRILQQSGHEIASAGSVEEALPLCREATADLVIVDWILDGASTGGDLVKSLHAECPGTRVMVLTGLDPALLASQTALPNVVKILAKPIELNEFNTAVAEILG